MRRLPPLLVLALAAVVCAVAWLRTPSTAQEATPAGAKPGEAEAGVRKNAEGYEKAFNAGDAKAAAASWVEDGEYTDPDGTTHRGRAAIEAELAAFFKAHPKATVEVAVETVRPLGKQTAIAEGSAKTRVPGEPNPSVARFSGLFVRENDGWKIATLSDWVHGSTDIVTLKDVSWLVGEWAARGDGGGLRVAYSFDEGKAFLTGKYTLADGGKVVSSGMQIIGANPAGGLRSWLFDGSGTTGESTWARDGNRWLVEAHGALPNGTEITATNVLIPLGPDAFTWQSVNRTAGGADLPDQPPVKVTRVKK
jgi:uncharacterized protein (TIGR02246 family)